MRSARKPRKAAPERRRTWQDELGCPGIVVSCQASLSRNLRGHPFPEMLDADGRRKLRDDLFARIRDSKLRGWVTANLDELDADTKASIVAEGLCSPELANVEGGGLAQCHPDPATPVHEDVTLFVNEDDHLRFRCELYGCDLADAYERVSAAESSLDGTAADYAFDPTFGYLTADPGHLGTGLHVGMALHLAGLRAAGDLDKVFRAMERLGMTIREVSGEGSVPNQGTIFEFFNAQTLGEDEQGIVERTDVILHDLAVQEDWARQRLMESGAGSGPIEDFLGRAYGVAMHAKRLSEAEANELNRAFIMGTELGVFDLRRGASPFVEPRVTIHLPLVEDGQNRADEVARLRADAMRELYSDVRMR